MAAQKGYVAVMTTVSGTGQAKALARRIVDARLAACVQFFPIRSVYRWKGKVESATETMLLAKTRSTLAPKLTAFIRRRHPYELPEITVTPIAAGLRAYLDWVSREVDAGS